MIFSFLFLLLKYCCHVLPRGLSGLNFELVIMRQHMFSSYCMFVSKAIFYSYNGHYCERIPWVAHKGRLGGGCMLLRVPTPSPSFWHIRSRVWALSCYPINSLHPLLLGVNSLRLAYAHLVICLLFILPLINHFCFNQLIQYNSLVNLINN